MINEYHQTILDPGLLFLPLLYRDIEYNRLILNRLAERLGRDNPLVMEQSERVDGLVVRLQRLT